ncbi:MAG: helix-turn-helix transcriptional regulator [Rhodobacteraceae bacterium]|nr:helix-turn-helix transcriptional regulator [Paracoccaceae bacterium]
MGNEVSVSIPLIRSGAILPVRRWLREHGRNEDLLLRKTGLEWVPRDDPALPISLHCAVRILSELAKTDGPDIPYRIVGDLGAFEIGLIGAVGLQGPTVGEGLRRMADTMRSHCTHEMFTVTTQNRAVGVMDGWSLVLGDDETLHYVQQYDIAIIDMICSTATGVRPNVSDVKMMPHPVYGLTHLRSWLGDRVSPADSRALTFTVGSDIASLSFPEPVTRAALAGFLAHSGALSPGAPLADDIATFLKPMLSRTKVSLEKVAAGAGMSTRTLRRRLKEEGTGFSDILERTRREIALRRLQQDNPPTMKALAKELGYANQATLTRARQRWRGQTPHSA